MPTTLPHSLHPAHPLPALQTLPALSLTAPPAVVAGAVGGGPRIGRASSSDAMYLQPRSAQSSWVSSTSIPAPQHRVAFLQVKSNNRRPMPLLVHTQWRKWLSTSWPKTTEKVQPSQRPSFGEEEETSQRLSLEAEYKLKCEQEEQEHFAANGAYSSE